QEALAADDVPIDVRGDLLVLLATAHLREGQPAQALPLLQELTRFRQAADDWCNLGTAYARLDQPDKALAAYEKALSINPFDGNTLAGLAEAHRRLGDAERAGEFARKARWL